VKKGITPYLIVSELRGIPTALYPSGQRAARREMCMNVSECLSGIPPNLTYQLKEKVEK